MNNAQEARRMLRAHRYGALSTLSQKFPGYPFGSITPYLVDHDGSLLILISELAEHTRNIQRDPSVCLITHDQRDPDIQTQGRVSALGDAALAHDQAQAAERYLRYFPDSRVYFELPGFFFFRIRPIAIRYIGGFGRIHWVDMENYSITHAAAFAKRDEILREELNSQHLDGLRHLLLQRHNIEVADPQIAGVDCDGFDVHGGGHLWRLDFLEPIDEPSQFIAAFTQLQHAPTS